MAFFNFYMLLGTLAISIPIVIHILNRKSAKKVMWGAMRFLRDSLVTRQRKILLEEILLMCTRCLLLLLLVLAAARPFITPGSQISWLVVLPLVLAAVAALASSFVLWAHPRWRRRLFVMAVFLLIGAGTALILEERLQSRIFGARGARDIALIMDASDSMSVTVDGMTNFERAVGEAERLVESAPLGSSFSLVVGGSIPYAPVSSPVNNREEVLAALRNLQPGKGSMRAPDTLALAAYTLARGNNPAKQILIFGDGQRQGWNLQDQEAWRAVSGSLEQLSSLPPVILRRLDLPGSFRNAAISDIRFSRDSFGLDRPVSIQVTLSNPGTESITPSRVVLRVGDVSHEDDSMSQLSPGTEQTFSFEHHFQDLKAQVVEAEVEVEDDLNLDNLASRVVNPVARLDVLIVDGNPGTRFFDRASAFAALALAPVSRTRRQAESTSDADAPSPDQTMIRPRIVNAADFPQLPSLDAYSVVILADVSRLPTAAADALARFVETGGGLLVAHGRSSLPEFYNHWRISGENVLPAGLAHPVFPAASEADGDGADPAVGVYPLSESFVHPALRIFQSEPVDLQQVLMRAYWKFETEENQKPSAHEPAARLSNRDPLLLERSLGEGRVLQLACGLDPRDSTFSTTRSFVILLHQLIPYLSAKGSERLNLAHQPGTRLSLSELIPADASNGRARLAALFEDKPDALRIVTAEGEESSGQLRYSGSPDNPDNPGDDVTLVPPPDLSPGVHLLDLPDALQPAFSDLLNENQHLPFAIMRESGEGNLLPLSEQDSSQLRRHLLWQEALNEESLRQALEGGRFGREIWRPLALAAWLLLIGEIALCRWIALRRRTGAELKTEFQERNQPKKSFLTHLEKMKASR
ncbi:MAG: BatA domain-containing protein [Kiritimatiellia bacterium]